MKKLTLFSKILIVLVVIGALIGGLKVLEKMGYVDSLMPAKTVKVKDVDIPSGAFKSNSSSSSSGDTLKVAVVTWGGYAGGQYFNRGFKPNSNSEYKKRYGMDVEFVVIDDYNASREAWKSGSVQALWTTADSFVTEVESLKSFDPKIVFQSDWSRGGDAIVTNRGINSVNDLKGKKVSVAFGTPSHTFLLWLLNAGGLKSSDIETVQAPSAVDSATYFKANKVDAAVVWSPDDEDCVANVQGSKVLKSTREASHIIADVFYVKNDYLQNNKDKVKNLIEGWMIGAAEINSNPAAKKEAIKILSEGLNQPEDFVERAISNTRLATIGDNKAFFGQDSAYRGVKGEDIYNSMGQIYSQINLAPSNLPAWRSVTDSSLIRSISLEGEEHKAEGFARFSAPTAEIAKKEAFSTKRVSISFASGSFTLDENSKLIIDREFVPVAKAFANSRIRIEGNTDNVGGVEANVILSKKRANSVSDYLVKQYGFDANRFVVVGNGPNKPVDSNDSAEGRAKNRRTDFELIGN